MFAGRITKQIEVGEYTVTIRKLSDRALDEAAEKLVDAQVGKSKEYGAELLSVFRQADAAKAETPQPEPEKPAEPTRQQVYEKYDKQTVLNKGLVSYVGPDGGDPVKVQGGKAETIAEIADLDRESATVIFHAIVDLSDPPRAEVDGVRGNA